MTDLMPPKKDETPWKAVEIVANLGISIALPTILFAVGGYWLDKRYGTSPLFLIAGFILSLIVSAYIAVKKGRQIAKQL